MEDQRSDSLLVNHDLLACYYFTEKGSKLITTFVFILPVLSSNMPCIFTENKEFPFVILSC